MLTEARKLKGPNFPEEAVRVANLLAQLSDVSDLIRESAIGPVTAAGV